MKTTCPHCNTAFRIHDEQLEQHGGDVRCGRCGEIFNGYEFLDEQLGQAQSIAPAMPAKEEAPPMAAPEPAPSAEVDFTLPDIPELDTVPEPMVSNLVIEPQTEEVVSAPQAINEVTSLGEIDKAEEDEADDAAAPRPARRWPWVTGCILALAGLAAQGAFAFRTELSLAYPMARPALEQLCSIKGCRIELPRQSDLLSIESSELQADPVRPEVIALIANLRNRGRHPQAYPLLELTLTDAQDKMLVRRVFQPEEYRPKSDLAGGFAPGSDIQVKLPLQLNELRAVGYRLYLYHPQT